jgi:hypothetical protein
MLPAVYQATEDFRCRKSSVAGTPLLAPTIENPLGLQLQLMS